jgi:hypothetical protein
MYINSLARLLSSSKHREAKVSESGFRRGTFARALKFDIYAPNRPVVDDIEMEVELRFRPLEH